MQKRRKPSLGNINMHRWENLVRDDKSSTYCFTYVSR